MKKTIKTVLILFSFITSFSLSFGMDISLKLSGGLCNLKLDDINRFLNSWEEVKKRTFLIREDWDYKGGEVKKLHIGYDIESEILISLSSHLAVGFGTGVIYGESTDEKTELLVDVDSTPYAYARPTKVTALPLTLSGYFFFPIRKNIDIFIKGAISLIWAKYIDREGYKQISEDNSEDEFDYYWHQSASAQGSAILGSLGIIYRVDPSIGFFLEGGVRQARISGFEGETPDEEMGELYSFEEYYSDIDFWRKNIMVFAEEPSGDNFRSVKKAVVDLSGFSAKIGLLIKF